MKTFEKNGKIYKLRPNGSLSVASVNKNPQQAQQQYRDTCDINKILKGYKVKGEMIPDPNRGHYLDLTEIPSYQEALHQIISANHAFNELPARTRKRFNNDPQELLQFIQDPNNKEEARTLGFLKEQTAPTKNDDLNDEPQVAVKTKIKPAKPTTPVEE